MDSHSSNQQIVGRQIKRHRKDAGLNQVQLALSAGAGWTYQKISKAETGRQPLALNELAHILHVIGKAMKPKPWTDEEYQRYLAELRPLITEPHPQVFDIIQGPDIFPGAIQHLLKQQFRKRVFVYAPTGVWDHDPYKPKWFQTLAGCLVKHLRLTGQLKGPPPEGADTTVTTALEQFSGVFGLPEKRAGVARQLDDIEKLLRPFCGLSNALLYRLAVDTSTIPGTGAIVIDDSAFIGFATQNLTKVDYVLALAHQGDVAETIADWFSAQVTHVATMKSLPIQYMASNTDLLTGMDNIRQDVYELPRKHPDIHECPKQQEPPPELSV